jgi:tRNA G18 (ribose-2'-O)-methylase SpoU
VVDNAAPGGPTGPGGPGPDGPTPADPGAVPTHGVGPHPTPWPDDPRLDPVLLADGDRRNVVDRYRYWSIEAIVADLDTRRFDYHVAIENLRHDMNIGTVVRNANAFGAAAVHVVGRRQWNRRGAMVTDRYVHVHHHPDVAAFRSAADELGLALVGIDVVDGSEPIDGRPLPRNCALVFGQEGSGLSPDLLAACDEIRDIPMFGSTRSVNVGVASGIAMTAWVRQHGPGSG